MTQPKEIFLSWGMLVLSVLFNAGGALMIKVKINEAGKVPFDTAAATVGYFLDLMKSPLAMAGVAIFFIAPFLFAVALSRMELVVAYPVQVGLNFVLIFVLAAIVIGEPVTVNRGIGSLLVLASIFFLAR